MTEFGPNQSPIKAPMPFDFRRQWRRFRKNIFVAFLIDLVVIVLTALVLSLFIKTFLVRSFFIPSGSMETTLQIDDRIMVNELVPDFAPLERGDVVVFRDPGGWLGPAKTDEVPLPTQVVDFVLSAFGIIAPDSDQHLVKRVIGVGGDRVVCCDADGKLSINGVAIDETYVKKGEKPSTSEFDVTVPEGSFWMMGDNRSNSADSRFHTDLPSKGFVSQEFIVGKAFVITFPVAHWTWLGNYPDVFKDVPKP